MSNSLSRVTNFRGQARTACLVARAAAVIGALVILARLLAVAAPLWHGADIATTLAKIGAQFALCVPAILYLVALEHSRRLFSRIGSGEVFSQANGLSIEAIGIAILIGGICAMLVSGLIPNAVGDSATYWNSHEVRAFDFGAANIALVALGIALRMFGRVLRTATDIKTENDGFV